MGTEVACSGAVSDVVVGDLLVERSHRHVGELAGLEGLVAGDQDVDVVVHVVEHSVGAGDERFILRTAERGALAGFRQWRLYFSEKMILYLPP